MTTRTLTYTLHCTLCGERLPSPPYYAGSRCRTCLDEALPPARWLLPTLAGLVDAAAYVVPVAGAVLVYLALRAL